MIPGYFKRYFFPAKALTVFLLAVSGAFPVLQARQSSNSQPVDGFAAVVNNRIITVGDVVERVRPALQQLQGQYRGSELVERQADVFEEGLDRLIEHHLILARAQNEGAELPRRVVRDQRDSMLRERFGNDENRLREALNAVGKTEAEWEQELKEQMLVQSMIQQMIRARIHVSPREIREAYAERKDRFRSEQELHLRAIAFRPPAAGMEQRREERIQGAKEALAAGETFAEVAKKYSDGPSAGRGGDEGWVNLSRLPQVLREGVDATEIGEITPLIESPTMSYIFKVEDRRGGEVLPLAEVQDDLERELRDKKFTRNYETWIDELSRQFTVQRFKPDLSAISGEME